MKKLGDISAIAVLGFISLVLASCGPDGASDGSTFNLAEPDETNGANNSTEEPVLEPDPETISFSSIPVGEVSWQFVEITNTGAGVLEFQDVSVQSGGEHFSVSFPDQVDDGEDLPPFEDDSDAPTSTLAPEDGPIVMRVVFDPAGPGTHSAAIAIETNESDAPQTLEANGEALDIECPVAQAIASVSGGNSWGGSVTAELGESIEFDGTGSHDPDGTSLNYDWSLVEQPGQSGAELDAPESAKPTMTVDAIGQYLVKLNVVDENGLESCNTAQVSIDVASSDIHVELTWEIPDSDENTEVDLDLHYLHSAGEWFGSPWDVYYLNPEPDWGDGSEVSLVSDSRDSEGPEHLLHDDPAAGPHYRSAVHYFSGGSPVIARVRIYLGGALVFDGERELVSEGVSESPESGHFWRVADIYIEDGGVGAEVIDEVYDGAGFPDE